MLAAARAGGKIGAYRAAFKEMERKAPKRPRRALAVV